MTFDEWVRSNSDAWGFAIRDELEAARLAWDAARAAEREECAKAVRAAFNANWASGASEARQMTQDAIDAIRARGNP